MSELSNNARKVLEKIRDHNAQIRELTKSLCSANELEAISRIKIYIQKIEQEIIKAEESLLSSQQSQYYRYLLVIPDVEEQLRQIYFRLLSIRD